MMKLVSDLPVVHVPIGKIASERMREEERRRRRGALLLVATLLGAAVAVTLLARF